MLHHPSGAARGQASDIHNEARELLYLRDYITALLAEATGKPFEQVPPIHCYIYVFGNASLFVYFRSFKISVATGTLMRRKLWSMDW